MMDTMIQGFILLKVQGFSWVKIISILASPLAEKKVNKEDNQKADDDTAAGSLIVTSSVHHLAGLVVASNG